MNPDQLDPNGELAKAINKAIASRISTDQYAHHFALLQLERAFKESQGNAEYRSWFKEHA